MQDVFICDYIRTPIGRFGGALSSVRADDLGAIPIKALVDRNPTVDWSKVDRSSMAAQTKQAKTTETSRACVP